MSIFDTIAFYTIYSTRLSRLVVSLPIPKRWKSEFVIWQFCGAAELAIKKLSAQKQGRIQA